MKRLHFANFDVAGFTYWDGTVVFDKLRTGRKLHLEFEADNKYDPKAVAIYYKKHKIGYVPRNANSEISKLCKQGYSNIFEVRINRLSPDQTPENQVGVVVYVVKNSNK